MAMSTLLDNIIDRLSRVQVSKSAKESSGTSAVMIRHITDDEMMDNEKRGYALYLKKKDITHVRGDWVYVNVDSLGRTVEILPKVVKRIYGHVTHYLHNHVIINMDTRCEPGLISPSWPRNQRMIVTVVRSDIFQQFWRAVNCAIMPEVNKNSTDLVYTVDSSSVDVCETSLNEMEFQQLMDTRNLKYSDVDDITIELEDEILNWSARSQNVIVITVRNNRKKSIVIGDLWFVCSSAEMTIDWTKDTVASLTVDGEGDTDLHVFGSSILPGQTCLSVIVRVCDRLYKKEVWIVVAPEPIDLDSSSVAPSRRSGNKNKGSMSFWTKKLNRFNIPEVLLRIRSSEELVKEYPFLKQAPTTSNYTRKMSILLYLEQLSQDLQLAKYVIASATLQSKSPGFQLEVPGVEDNKPPITIGDVVIIRFVTDPHNVWSGCIKDIDGSKVLMQFPKKFNLVYSGQKCQIRFKVNEVPFRRQQYCLDKSFLEYGSQVFFPIEYSSWRTKDTLDVDYINENLNEEQRSAVNNILKGACKPAPYVIYGPPGTGKTMTVVEGILQVYTRIPDSRILVVAPSNSACDLLTSRILESYLIENAELVRVLASSRKLQDLSEDIRVCSVYSTDFTDLDYRIVLCTAATSFKVDIKNGYSHLFIDEAGQLTETQICVPLSMLGKDPHVVLAGDPNQLGPVIQSDNAKKFGFHISMLQRLTSSVIYQPSVENEEDKLLYDAHLVTQLTRNYRSHPDIISVPSKLFYYSTLKPALSIKESSCLLGWRELPNRKCPLLFHGVIGTSEQRGCPSWSNIEEAELAAAYAMKLLKFGMDSSDIGIITPYRKQVQRIRQCLSRRSRTDFKVASVEEFQGQERKAIILSTVRSSKSLVAEDLKMCLGFVKSPQRFNVAITRSQFLLVVIGNPLVLQTDKNWNSLLQFCLSKKAYRGVPLKPCAET